MDNRIILTNDLNTVRYYADRKRVTWTYKSTVTMLEHLVNYSKFDIKLFCEFYEKLVEVLDNTDMHDKCARYWRATHVF